MKSGGKLWPEARAFHAACCLNYGQQFPQLLVTGGLGKDRKPLGDIWIFDIERGKWRKVTLNIIIATYSKLCILVVCQQRRVCVCEGVGQVCLFIIPRTANPTASVDSHPPAHCHNTPAPQVAKISVLAFQTLLTYLALILMTGLFINRLYC